MLQQRKQKNLLHKISKKGQMQELILCDSMHTKIKISEMHAEGTKIEGICEQKKSYTC